jgi:hypothetical protein
VEARVQKGNRIMELDYKGKKIKYYTIDGLNGIGRVLEEDDEKLKVSNVLEAAVDDNFCILYKQALVKVEFLRDIN